MSASEHHDRRIDAVKDRLSSELVDQEGHPADPDQVARAVETAGAELADAPVQEFVPLLVEHDAREELRRQQGLHRELSDVDDGAPPRRADDQDGTKGPVLSTQQGIPAP